MAADDLILIESGRQDSNLRPSAPKALRYLFEINQYFPTITRVCMSSWNEFESQYSAKYILLYKVHTPIYLIHNLSYPLATPLRHSALF